MKRREAVRRVGLAAAGLCLAPRAAAREDRAPSRTPAGIEELARLFRETPRQEVLDTAAGAIRSGADLPLILGAVFMAGIQDVQPRHVGGKLHCVMMVESVFQLAGTLPPQEAWLTALWCLDDFKRSQGIDRREGDWTLPPRPESSFTSESAARKEFLSAMEDWDSSRADRAIVGLLAYHDRDSLFEILWPLAARSYVDIGHKIIFGAQVERVLRRIDWSHAEPVVRSLVFGLLHQNPDRRMEVYGRSREIAHRLPGGWLEGREDPAESERLLRQARKADSAGAQDLLIEAFRAGLGPATVWDGLRLAASETFLRRPPSAPERRQALLPVHAVTVTNAFGHAWRAARDESTRRLLILQAAGWLPALRDDLRKRGCHLDDGPSLDSLGAAESADGPAIDEIFERRSPALARSWIDRRPEGAEAFRQRLRVGLSGRAVEHHQHKYAAAFMEESRLAHPRWASRLLAPAIDYLPGGKTPDTDIARRSLRALVKAGVV